MSTAKGQLSVTVLITVFNEVRVDRTLASLAHQLRAPDRVLVADGGSTDDTLRLVGRWSGRLPLDVRVLTGSVAETRAKAIPVVEDGIVVFLDADQQAPPHWLERIVAPIEAGDADVTGGPTRPLTPPASRAERYINEFEAWFYEHVVADDPTMVPMGNSAWRRSVFDRAGNFDARLVWGGEDYDMNLRAASTGHRFRFVPDAWVHHDQAHLRTLQRVLRRKYRYSKGATMAYLKNGVLAQRIRPAASTVRFRHPYEWLALAVKPMAAVAGWWAWRRVRDRPSTPS